MQVAISFQRVNSQILPEAIPHVIPDTGRRILPLHSNSSLCYVGTFHDFFPERLFRCLSSLPSRVSITVMGPTQSYVLPHLGTDYVDRSFVADHALMTPQDTISLFSRPRFTSSEFFDFSCTRETS